MADDTVLRARYEALKERASEILRRGGLREALGEFEKAHELAKQIGDRDLEDLAFCNWSAVAIEMRRTDCCVPALRQLLLRTTNPHVARHSAYNLAAASDCRKDYKKQLFYSRIAHRYSVELEETDHEASALNEIGNALVALNDFEGAIEEYLKADSLLSAEQSDRRAVVLANLGYCYLLTSRTEEGLSLVVRGLRMARRAVAPAAESLARLCLAFGQLLIGRPWYGLRHGSKAYKLAELLGDQKIMKYALLLIGEAYKQGGEVRVARECFELLQQSYYPGMPEVPEMLLDVDVCRVINLRG